jgi:hypothetical protein
MVSDKHSSLVHIEKYGQKCFITLASGGRAGGTDRRRRRRVQRDEEEDGEGHRDAVGPNPVP